MKSEAWIFAICTIFLVLVSPAYWFITSDWTGTSALVMTTLLTGMVTLYLGFHAKNMDPRPEDRKDGEIADGAGELGSSRRTPGGRCGARSRSPCACTASRWAPGGCSSSAW